MQKRQKIQIECWHRHTLLPDECDEFLPLEAAEEDKKRHDTVEKQHQEMEKRQKRLKLQFKDLKKYLLDILFFHNRMLLEVKIRIYVGLVTVLQLIS